MSDDFVENDIFDISIDEFVEAYYLSLSPFIYTLYYCWRPWNCHPHWHSSLVAFSTRSCLSHEENDRAAICDICCCTSWLRNLAPTICFYNITDVDHLNTSSFFCYFKGSLQTPHEDFFSDPKSTTTQIIFCWIGILAWEVSHKSVLAVPWCMERVLCWFSMQHGKWKQFFATPPQQEGNVVHLFHSSPARSLKIMKMLFSDHCLSVTFSRARQFSNSCLTSLNCMCFCRFTILKSRFPIDSFKLSILS